MSNNDLVIFVTDCLDQAQQKFSESLLRLAEGWLIPENYSPSEIREILVHAGFNFGSLTGLGLAERLHKKEFAVSGVPVIFSAELGDHLKKLAEFPSSVSPEINR